MPPWSPAPNSQYLSTVLNDSNAPIPSHAAGASPSTTTTTTTPPRPRHFPPQPQPSLTPAQRSAQARGKPHEPAASGSTTKTKPPVTSEAESYATRERRHEAAAILDSQELLLWYAAARNESVSATRRWFRNVVLGVEQGERVWREEWEVSDAGGGGRRVGKGEVRRGVWKRG